MKKISIFCPYSYPSTCGIWSRVYSDAIALKKEGYEVSIFSSNVIKGTDKTSEEFQEIDGLKIYRFKVLFSLGGTSMFWNFLPKLSEYNPDIIHVHGYRHPHSLLSHLWGKINRRKTILTTHAPFEKDSRRSVILKIFDFCYDIFIGWWELKLYNNVIRISNWEEPYLQNLGMKNSIIITNGLNQLFLDKAPEINDIKYNKVIYLGRIDPVKRLEWIIEAAENLTEVNFKIVGPLSGYDEFNSPFTNLQIDIKKYSPQEFIEEAKNADIYVLPSAREAMPFTLLEAMSQGKFVISSQSNGAKEVIKNNENGFIVNNPAELIEKIKYIYNNWEKLQYMRYNSIDTSKSFSAAESNQRLIELYNKL